MDSRPILIGRADDSTLVLDDDYASSRHARIYPDRDGQWIVDRDDEGVDMALVRRHRIPVVLGDLGSEDTLALLRLESARALMVMTGDEVRTSSARCWRASGHPTCAWCCGSSTTIWPRALTAAGCVPPIAGSAPGASGRVVTAPFLSRRKPW